MRPLSIPCMKDRAMQTLYKFALEPIAEITADPNSYGFRAKRCVQDAIEQCFTCLNKAKSPKWVLEGDIKGCFDNISHEWILNHIPMDKDILRNWLKSGYVETGRLFPTDLGSPQGSAISPTICNMVLDGLEIQIKKKYHKTKRDGKAYFPKVNFIRYADDFIVTGESRELLEAGVLPIIREFLSERGLELSEEKTVITHIEDGFDFLGCNIRWYKDKLLTKPSKKNYKAIVSKVREIIKQNPSMKQEDLIRKLNPVIRGWVNFQKYNVSSQAFERFDFDVWRCLWRWCKRRHPKKGHKWIAKKYFRRVGTRYWTFSVNMADSFELHLIYATDTKIVRWLKTKSEATPFDERFTEYFEDRDTKRMLREINGRKKLNALYKMQKGICPHCGEPITVERGFRIHTEVGKLNMLKASYLSQKYALEDMVLKKYPEAITRLTERIAGYEEDAQLAAAHPKPQEGFAGITILEQPYAEKEAAGKAILDVCTKVTGSDAVFLGQYRGFSLTLSYDGASNEYRMTMKGTLSHTAVLGADVFGNLNRMDNVIDGLSGKLEAVRTELADTRIQLENVRTELAAPFSREAELAEKTARLRELNILLNMDQKDNALIDDAPDEDAPERPRSKEMER